jgi:hypothetical protein
MHLAKPVLVWFDLSTTVFAVRSAEEILDLIPYVGFFGAILGMSGALWILGSIDISNQIQKATQIASNNGQYQLGNRDQSVGTDLFYRSFSCLRHHSNRLQAPGLGSKPRRALSVMHLCGSEALPDASSGRRARTLNRAYGLALSRGRRGPAGRMALPQCAPMSA